MKHMKQKLLALGSALALTASLAGPAMAAEADAGISVQLDGQNVAFTDVKPEAHSGRTFLPFRAVFEAMGAQVDYKADTQTILADRDGTHLEMTLGSKDVKITENGESRTVTMDVAPYAKSNRTYVPVRFAAEAFGCNVGWDQDDQTVIIADVDKLMGGATYELMDNYCAYAARQTAQSNQAVKGDLSMKLTVSKEATGTEKDMSIPVTATLSGISSQTAGQLKMTMDLSGIMDMMTAEDTGLTPAEFAAMKAQLKQITAEIRMDLETGMYYINCPVLAQLMGNENGDKVWFSMDFNALLASSGIDLSELVAMSRGASGSMKDVLASTLSAIPLTDKDTDYTALSAVAKVYSDMLSDQAFVKNGSTYTSTFSMKEDGADMTMKLVLTAKGEDIVGMKMDMSMKAAGTDPDPSASAAAGRSSISMDMSMTSTVDKMTMTLDMDLMDLITLTMEMNMTSSATSDKPVTTLPANAVVVPLDSVLQ